MSANGVRAPTPHYKIELRQPQQPSEGKSNSGRQVERDMCEEPSKAKGSDVVERDIVDHSAIALGCEDVHFVVDG